MSASTTGSNGADVVGQIPAPDLTGYDPYRRCEERCNHDTNQGVQVVDLLSGDGPWDTSLSAVVGYQIGMG